MEPKIVSRPAFTIVGMKYHGKNEQNEIPQMWEAFLPRVGDIQRIVNPGVAYGVCGNNDENGEFDYVAGFEVDTVTDVPESMVSWELSEGTYAVFTCTLTGIREAFHHALYTWLPQSGYRYTGGAMFELYDENFDPNSDEPEMYIYIPIK